MNSLDIRPHLIIAISLLLLAVVFGALGAHSLKGILSTEQLGSYQTAVNYQMSQSLGALLLLVLSLLLKPKRKLRLAAFLLLVGVFLFSGSIYTLVLPIFEFIPKAIAGPITPIGGILFILGWGIALLAIIKLNNHA